MSCKKCAGRTEERKGGQYCERCGYQNGDRSIGQPKPQKQKAPGPA